jgi:hypothetical protein
LRRTAVSWLVLDSRQWRWAAGAKSTVNPFTREHLFRNNFAEFLGTLASSYNEVSNENLVDPGFDGGFVLGAGRPELDTTATSYRAIGDEVPSAAIRSNTRVGNQPIQCSGAGTGSGDAC